MPLQDTDPTPSFGGFGLSYAFSLIAGKWLFHDDLSLIRIAGVTLIILGALVVSRS